MALSPFTFTDAVQLLEPGRGGKSVLDKVLGGLIFAGAGAATVAGGPVGGLTAAAFLALVDPKNEATKLLGSLVTSTVTRLKGIPRDEQYAVIAAAHTVTVLSSFFDALQEKLGPVYPQLAVTEQDKRRLAGGQVGGQGSIEDLFGFEVRLPSAQYGLTENLEQNLRPYFRRLADRCLKFFDGLEAWKQARVGSQLQLAEDITERSATMYRDRMLALAPQPPFALWLTLNEHAADRSLAREQHEETTAALAELPRLLSIAMTGSPPAKRSLREQLARTAEEVLGQPLLRSELQTPASPTVREGFVEPAFKLAIRDEFSEASDEAWWSSQVTSESLVQYLAGYLADDASTQLPLLLLGHPGAGKSLLTEVLGAQLPAESFAVVRIPLRRVATDEDLATQITKELQRTLQRSTATLENLRAECDNCRLVVLLDGLDELVQATGVSQFRYLTKIETFQKQALTLGEPTSVIVTSRVLVADQVDIPLGTPMVKLCEFDDGRIVRWTNAWNAAHLHSNDFQPLDLTALTDQPGVAELVRQPLLLLIFAVYLAELGTSLPLGADLSQATLYRRILDHFIKRQVTEKSEPDAAPELQRRLELAHRKQLQFAAFGMFNRGRQYVTSEELDQDLIALADQSPAGRAAHSVLGEFMFVHNAKADREQRNSYEFLHATFGEYLVAELTLDLLIEPDHELLARLLSHQPLSTRRPVLDFLLEMASPTNRPTLLRTISGILIAALLKPDTGDDPYQPLDYDPVRRRAAYTANLALFRVLLDQDPVSKDDLVGTIHGDRWERLVRLWRAGLDRTAWAGVVERLGAIDEESYFPGDHRIVRRTTPRSSAVGEAELVGDRATMAMLISADFAFIEPHEFWTDDQLVILSELSQILHTNTGMPHSESVLPFDFGWFSNLLIYCTRYELNDNLRCALLVMLSRTAPHLPYEYVKELLVQVLPAPDDNYTVEIGAVVAAKPQLLRDYPAIRDILLSCRVGDTLALIVILWHARSRTDHADYLLIAELLATLDRSVARATDGFVTGYFTPEFFTYLRQERPQYWLDSQLTLTRFSIIPDHFLAQIQPADALWAAETWPIGSGAFATDYLSGRSVEVEPDEDPLPLLRRLVAEADRVPPL